MRTVDEGDRFPPSVVKVKLDFARVAEFSTRGNSRRPQLRQSANTPMPVWGMQGDEFLKTSLFELNVWGSQRRFDHLQDPVCCSPEAWTCVPAL